MAKQLLQLGTTVNDGTGDALRNGGEKINDNFTELYNMADYENNSTTTALSLSTLNSTYPDAVVGFRVFCLSITSGALIYYKTESGWVSSAVTIVT